MKSATRSRTDAQLAVALGVTPGAITNARKRNTVPRKWYNRLITACAQLSGGVLGGAASVTGIISPHMAINVATVTHDLIESFAPEQMVEWVKTGLVPKGLPQIEEGATIHGLQEFPQMKRLRGDLGGNLPQHSAVFSDAFLQSKGPVANLYVLNAPGDFMAPEIREGDVVLVHTGHTLPRPGKIFAVGIGNVVILQRVFVDGGRIALRYDNPPKPYADTGDANQPENLSKILGQVVAICRRWDAD